MNCSRRKAAVIGSTIKADFDPQLIPPHLRDTFMNRLDGICIDCGLYQDFLRFTPEEMKEFATFNKDESVSESAFGSFPVPKDFVSKFEDLYVARRVQMWHEYLRRRALRPRRCLLLRPMFGGTAEYLSREWGAEIDALEISEVCRRSVKARLPHVRFLSGQIHGLLDGDFLDSAPYDAIFVFHTLIHCIDVHEALRRLRGLVVDGGFVVFSQEIQIKPHNPFHLLFPTEFQFVRLLNEHFAPIDRIDDCDPHPPNFITNFSSKGDSPDIVAFT